MLTPCRKHFLRCLDTNLVSRLSLSSLVVAGSMTMSGKNSVDCEGWHSILIVAVANFYHLSKWNFADEECYIILAIPKI